MCAMSRGHCIHDGVGAAAAEREGAGWFGGLDRLRASDVNNRLLLVRDGYWDSAGGSDVVPMQDSEQAG
jgi:hypothetical protein